MFITGTYESGNCVKNFSIIIPDIHTEIYRTFINNFI